MTHEAKRGIPRKSFPLLISTLTVPKVSSPESPMLRSYSESTTNIFYRTYILKCIFIVEKVKIENLNSIQNLKEK
jgi:hypothetical protein